MFTNFSLNTLGIAGVTLAGRPAFAQQHGFGGCDLPLAELRDRADAQLARATARAAGVRWALFDSPVHLDTSDAQFDRGLSILEEKAPLLAEPFEPWRSKLAAMPREIAAREGATILQKLVDASKGKRV